MQQGYAGRGGVASGSNRSYSAGMHGLLFGKTEIGFARQWHVPELFSLESTGLLTGPVVSLGPSGTGLAWHSHGAAWETVVAGLKLVLLAPPMSDPAGKKFSQ